MAADACSIKGGHAATPVLGLPRASLALLTDLYELTMACGYWKSGTTAKEAAFHLAFRQAPFEGGFTVACGLAAVIDYLRTLRFEKTDLDYLATILAKYKRVGFEQPSIDK